jgi:hypothetical protein
LLAVLVVVVILVEVVVLGDIEPLMELQAVAHQQSPNLD